ATYLRTKQQVVYAAQQTYLQGVLAFESKAAAQRAVDAATESLRVAQAKFSAGASARLDVLQAEVAAANAEQTKVQAETGVANAQAALNAALNLPQDTSLELTGTLLPRPGEGTLADAIARALRDRVDLEVRQAWLAAQRAAGELAAATKAVEQGRESARLASARYQAGVGTSLELLSAQSGLAQAEQALASAHYDQNAARIQLILATG